MWAEKVNAFAAVGASNGGFGSEGMNTTLGNALRTITGNETLKTAPDQLLNAAMMSLQQPAKNNRGVESVKFTDKISAPATPTGRDNSGRGI